MTSTPPDPTTPDPTVPAPSEESQAQQQPVPAETTVQTEVTIRQVPRYLRFVLLGAGLGAIVTFILTASFPSDPSIGFGPLFGYFLIYGIPAGAVLGTIVALIVDRAVRNRRGTGTAEQTVVDPLRYDDEPEQPVAGDPESIPEND